MFKVKIGKEGLKNSHQDEFPETTTCLCCGGTARIGFVAHEEFKGKSDSLVHQLHKNDPKGDGYWLHDACSVAVYFCRNCLEPTALANQG